MRCQLCLNFSWQPICKECLDRLFVPTPKKRVLQDGLNVYSCYAYKDIKELLHTKHTLIGSKVFSILTRHALLPLTQNFKCKDIFSIPIDDHTREGYSHSAIIAYELRTVFTPLYGALRAKNRVRYSGQKRDFRMKQKRDFRLTCKEGISVVLVDDIVTSGSTLLEANATCKKGGVDVAFALCLADASG